MTELIWDGKYVNGKKTVPVRLALPFQDIETVNESAQERNLQFDLWSSGQSTHWRNRLIWGDKKYVLPSLLPEFAGKVDLIYIDPPFNTGSDFSFTATIPDDPNTPGTNGATFVKEPSMIEQKAYRDTWGRGLDGYLQWFYETAVLLHELLAETGSLYVHLDWHTAHYSKTILDEVFGRDNFLNEIVWWYYNKFQGNINRFASNHDVIFWYRKSDKFMFNQQRELRDQPTKQIKRVWDKEVGKIVNAKDEQGRVVYQEATHRTVDDVWRISMLQPADETENLRYATQKPEALLERIIKASSNEGDLVLDCFCGSGTTAAVAEKLGRRWITCDLGRFAIHTTRKRLLGIANVKPFVVQNLGKYERQAWQTAEFGDGQRAALAQERYRRFILDLYHAEPLSGYQWLHGVRNGHFVHIGSVDAPILRGDLAAIAREFWQASGKGDGATVNSVDILGWDFAFELNEVGRQTLVDAGIKPIFKRIPREVLERKAVEQGDIRFFELAALDVQVNHRDTEGTEGFNPSPSVISVSSVVQPASAVVQITLRDFVVHPDDVPQDVQQAITHWSQWIDYWAVDWDFQGDTFHNQWQAYRTKKSPQLQTSVAHRYEQPGLYTVVVKVIDILGNDTTKSLTVEIK